MVKRNKNETYIFGAVELLQHVFPDHGGRELDDEEQDVDRSSLRVRVLSLNKKKSKCYRFVFFLVDHWFCLTSHNSINP